MGAHDQSRAEEALLEIGSLERSYEHAVSIAQNQTRFADATPPQLPELVADSHNVYNATCLGVQLVSESLQMQMSTYSQCMQSVLHGYLGFSGRRKSSTLELVNPFRIDPNYIGAAGPRGPQHALNQHFWVNPVDIVENPIGKNSKRPTAATSHHPNLSTATTVSRPSTPLTLHPTREQLGGKSQWV